jgi:methyl coenzyme M reductase alpha subunit
LPWPPPCPVSVATKSVLGPVSSHTTVESWPWRVARMAMSNVGGGATREGAAAAATGTGAALGLGNAEAEVEGMGDREGAGEARG